MSKRQRGYKAVDDPEILRDKLEKKQKLQKELREEEVELESKLQAVSKRLGRCETYVQNMGRKLTLMKTYDTSWYCSNSKDDNANLFFLEEFVVADHDGNLIDASRVETEDLVPTHGHGILFTPMRPSGKFVVRDVGGTELEIIEGSYKLWQVCRQRRKLSRLGVLVPDLEFLVTQGNRQLSRLLEICSSLLPEGEYFVDRSYYGSVGKAKKMRFTVHPTKGHWVEVVIRGD